MRKLSPVLGLVLALAVGALPALAITWGQPDTEHTNVGAMMVERAESGEKYPICSGTLVHNRVFLTAGHCTEALQARLESGWYVDTWVSFAQDPAENGDRREVQTIITHPDYYWGPQSNPHDAGVLVLAEAVTDIEPAELPEAGFLDRLREAGLLNQGKTKAKFTVVGYGATLEWPPPFIYYEDQRQFAVSEYRALLKAWLRMSQNQATGDGGTCYGDSGGPTFWTEPDGSEILVGITSWGDAQCVSSEFNYRVDIPETLDFIDSVIKDLE